VVQYERVVDGEIGDSIEKPYIVDYMTGERWAQNRTDAYFL
jgi:hypothetical protein